MASQSNVSKSSKKVGENSWHFFIPSLKIHRIMVFIPACRSAPTFTTTSSSSSEDEMNPPRAAKSWIGPPSLSVRDWLIQDDVNGTTGRYTPCVSLSHVHPSSTRRFAYYPGLSKVLSPVHLLVREFCKWDVYGISRVRPVFLWKEPGGK